MSDDSLYFITAASELRRFEFDGTTSSLVATYQLSLTLHDHADLNTINLAPNLVLVTTYSNRIIALDARTLEERYHFHLPPEVSWVADLTVMANEVFSCDPVSQGRSCLHVFSLTGEYLRAIRGPWREPRIVTHYKGRLFVTEYAGEDEGDWALETGPDGEELEEEDWSAEKKAAGKRIFVITPQGETLQVFDQFPTPIHEVRSMAVAGNRLVVCCDNLDEDRSSTAYELKGA